MISLFQLQSTLLMIVTVFTFALQAWAFVDALSHRPDAFVAADKQTKNLWLLLLGIAVAAHLLIWDPFSLLNLIGMVATIVYLVDARPALRSLTGR